MISGNRKICCIGFQKTGTSSLAAALERLGYSVGHAYEQINAVLDPLAPDADQMVERIALEVLARHDAIQDSPSAFCFKAFDAAYPGSKFILTVRPAEAWLASYARFFGGQNNPLRRWMYKADRLEGFEAQHLAVYNRQIAAMRDYFRDRPQDFLEMDLSRGDGWAELVAFLGRDFLPPFPRENIGGVQAPRRKGLGLGRILGRAR